MSKREFKTEQRISNMMKDNKNFDNEDVRKIYYAFDKLSILKKEASQILADAHERTFMLEKEEYNEKMQWINDFMESKGIDEKIFKNLDDYKIASDDYDYYYEFKTPTQYKKDEEKRKAKKMETRPSDGEGREPAD